MMPSLFDIGPGCRLTLRSRLSAERSGQWRNGGLPRQFDGECKPGTTFRVVEINSELGYDLVRLEFDSGPPNRFITIEGQEIMRSFEFVPAGELSAKRFTVDQDLLRLSRSIDLRPPHNHAVFWCETAGQKLAEAFVAKNHHFRRLDDILQDSPNGLRLYRHLTSPYRSWSDVEEIWWDLSFRMATAASGIVNAFVPPRFTEDRPVSDFKHRFSGNYADTQFEKIELLELESNPNVTQIFLNGMLISG